MSTPTRPIALALLGLAWAWPALSLADERPPPQAPSTWWEETGPDGEVREFRVAFDPATDAEIGIAASAAGTSDEEVGFAAELWFGAQYRGWLSTGEGESLVSWQIDNHFFEGWMRMPSSDQVDELDFTVYRGEYLRHDELPHLTVPGSNPTRVPFPFDIGLETEAFRIWLEEPAEDGARDLRLGVAQGALLLDPWRTGEPGRSLEFGLGAWYDVDLGLDDAWRIADTVHRVAPLTVLSARFRYQDDPGLTRFDVGAAFEPHMRVVTAEWEIAASAFLAAERTLIALNDQPLNLRFDSGWQMRTDPRGEDVEHDLRAQLGLVWAFQVFD